MSDFVIENGVLTKYTGTEEVITIPEGVKVIGSSLLGWRQGDSVKKVIIPDGVTEIRESAFQGSKLEEITIPKSVTKIGGNAFNACHNLKSVTLPEGITCLAENLFSFSGVEEVRLPESLQKIEERAFHYCKNLKKINLPDPERIKIGKSAFGRCDGLTDENGLLILQNRLFTFGTDATATAPIRIPDNVTVIEEHSNSNEYRPLHIQMRLHCPLWTTSGAAKKFGFATSFIQGDGSTISFLDDTGKVVAKVILAIAEETEPKKNGAILSIRQENHAFDFAGYDANWANLGQNPNKIRVALVRLQYPYALSAEMEEIYLTFLKKQAVTAGKLFVDTDNMDAMVFLSEKDAFNANAIAKLTDHAKETNKAEFTAWLLNYANTKFGGVAKPKSSAGTLGGALPKPKEGKAPAEWRKLFKFKYADGGIVIIEYLGSESDLEIPEKIGDKYVVGIGRRAFHNMLAGIKKLKHLTIPGSVTNIEQGAFWCIKNIEITFCEGITTLEDETFFLSSKLTIKLPASLSKAGALFDFEKAKDKITINMVVPRGSFAEELCKQQGLSYTTYESDDSAEDKAEKIREEIQKSKQEKTSKKAKNPWKAPKPGTHLIGRYCGVEAEVTFPTEVDGVAITGIANTSGETPENYKAITSVIIPEGYTVIGKKAFAGCEQLKSIVLPKSLRQIDTGAFEGCTSLKELYISNEVELIGKDIFAGAKIENLVLNTTNVKKLPTACFRGSEIANLVIIGGNFKTVGYAFGVKDYEKKLYYFPEKVYINGKFESLDILEKGSLAHRLVALQDFNEETIESEELRTLLQKDKLRKNVFAGGSKALAVGETVEKIDFSNDVLSYTGFGAETDWFIYELLERIGASTSRGVSEDTQFLIIPDGDFFKNADCKKAEKLKAKGADLAIITVSELKRHIALADKDKYGEEGAALCQQFIIEDTQDGIVLTHYIGSQSEVVIPEKIGEKPIIKIDDYCFFEGDPNGFCKNLKSVVVPASVLVEDYAFSGYSPAQVKKILRKV